MRKKQYFSTSDLMYILAGLCVVSGAVALAIYAYRRGRAIEIKRRNGWT